MKQEELNKEIASLEEKISANNKRVERLKDLRAEMEDIASKIKMRKKKMLSEQKDVSQLEKLNMRSLFIKILGNIDEQVEKERQEYLHEVLCYNSLVEEYQTLEEEYNILQPLLLPDIEKLEREMNRYIKRKEAYLLRCPENEKVLSQIDSRRYRNQGQKKHLEEAIAEAKQLSEILTEILDKLAYVKAWGPINMSGKGRYSSYNKKSYIDKANRQVVKANVQIKKFDKELKDIYPDLDAHFTLLDFEKFIDDFYDQLITDWVVQKKLDMAIHGVELVYGKLKRLQMMLEQDKSTKEREIEEIEKERMIFIKES